MKRIKIIHIDPLTDTEHPLAIGMTGTVAEELEHGDIMVDMDNPEQFDNEPVHVYAGEFEVIE
ncbi:MAG: hypothetical protein ACRC7W_00570 [Fusobacteriaceae bacterium]